MHLLQENTAEELLSSCHAHSALPGCFKSQISENMHRNQPDSSKQFATRRHKLHLLFYLNNKALKYTQQYLQRYISACIEKVIGLQNNGYIFFASNSSVCDTNVSQSLKVYT